MLGKPKFKVGDHVQFDMWYRNEKMTVYGYVYIIDRFGTFKNDTDVSYDIMTHDNRFLYKHIGEKSVQSQEN